MRAILLAAGMGTRLRPLTENTPKSLIKINGEPLLERQIKFLKEKQINEIYIVIGYLSEKFSYLEEKYNVKLIENRYYDKYNNLYTMYLVRNHLKDAYVIDADVYLRRNIFKKNLKKSCYFSGMKETQEKEWKLIFNEELKVIEIEEVSGKNYIMSGVSYWNKEDGEYLKKELEKAIEMIDTDEVKNYYWDNIVRNNLNKLNVNIEKINSDDWYEIDTIEDYKQILNII